MLLNEEKNKKIIINLIFMNSKPTPSVIELGVGFFSTIINYKLGELCLIYPQ
jgi:hypothetical protein